MIKQIAHHVVGTTVIVLWVTMISMTLGVLVASATNFAGIVW
jgi:hypothetical protein